MWWKNFQFHTRIVVEDAFTLAVVVVVAAAVVEVRPSEVDYDASYKRAIFLLMLLLSTLLRLLLLLR